MPVVYMPLAGWGSKGISKSKRCSLSTQSWSSQMMRSLGSFSVNVPQTTLEMNEDKVVYSKLVWFMISLTSQPYSTWVKWSEIWLNGDHMYSKGIWKGMVWARAWDLEDVFWQVEFRTRRHLDLISRISSNCKYLTWWYLSDKYH